MIEKKHKKNISNLIEKETQDDETEEEDETFIDIKELKKNKKIIQQDN